MSPPRVVVVGAGPAGTRAAEALVAAGLHPTVVDESPASGGQIHRRLRPPLSGTRPRSTGSRRPRRWRCIRRSTGSRGR